MVRKATVDDVDEINKLGELLHHNFKRLFHIETEIESKYGIVLVSESNNVIDGFLYAVHLGDNIDLLSIVVSVDKRCQGIGRQLLKFLIDNECCDESITLEVAVNNIEAIKLYEKFHFEVENIRRKYYNNLDAYLMRRK